MIGKAAKDGFKVLLKKAEPSSDVKWITKNKVSIQLVKFQDDKWVNDKKIECSVLPTSAVCTD
ncbi:MAG: hypothetical protein EOP06_05640 [Proteobacteria bacterium]|nr:MAG: hypothetical protein EOP06_05640 [Pseudomonadota bacterium]